jgi:hypothetical protein
MIAKSPVLCVSKGTPWMLAVASLHSGGQTPPLARDLSGDGKRLKRSLDGAEPLGSQRTLIVIDRDKDTEVQLGHRGHADGRLDISRRLPTDENRSIQQRAHALGERILK